MGLSRRIRAYIHEALAPSSQPNRFENQSNLDYQNSISNRNSPKDSEGRGFRASMEYAISCGVSPEVVYDVGAANGTHYLYEAFPRALHMLFDPLPSHIECLKKSFSDPRFEIHEVALGREKTLGTLHVPTTATGKKTWSSLQGITDQMKEQMKERGASTEGIDIQVPIHPLDHYLRQGPCVIKIDTEGHELEVLMGATTVLKQCQLLIIELSIFPRYTGEGRFAEIVSFLHAQGFELFDIPNLMYPLQNSDLSHIDATFVPMADRRAGQWIERQKHQAS
jgi:FkbM family methyltransferase